jgi:drug/metabolite transporter (DMT)-like permease
VTVGAALCSALCFALSTVLQHRTAARAPRSDVLGVGLFAHLLSRPLWLLGLVADGAGLGLHVLALSVGQLALIQPLLVSGMLFALPLEAAIDRRRPALAEWAWGLVVVVGLSMFLVASRPTAGRPQPNPRLLMLVCGASLVAAALAVTAGHLFVARHRAALLGLATGIMYGITAVLIKETVDLATSPSRVTALAPLAGLLAVGGLGITLNQSAYQSGPLAASLPPITIADPVVAVIIGVVAFDEELASSPLAVAAQVVGFAAMAVGVVRLARLTALPVTGTPAP